jgi:pyridoxal phosphate enzyme (YggS family)
MTETRMVQDTLSDRLASIESQIRSAAAASNRAPDDVRLIAISKTHPPALIKEALASGATDLGENRVQEAEPKILEIGRSAARWHLVGHLQTNKARRAVRLFDVIHSLDSIELAKRLDRLCAEESRKDLEVLIQVDLGHETTKSGTTEDELPDLIQVVRESSNLKLLGLMTLPPFFDDAEMVRPYFRKLRELRDQLADDNAFGSRGGELSMGMTHDFEVAIQEGATMVRIGTAIFGERDPNVR